MAKSYLTGEQSKALMAKLPGMVMAELTASLAAAGLTDAAKVRVEPYGDYGGQRVHVSLERPTWVMVDLEIAPWFYASSWRRDGPAQGAVVKASGYSRRGVWMMNTDKTATDASVAKYVAAAVSSLVDAIRRGLAAHQGKLDGQARLEAVVNEMRDVFQVTPGAGRAIEDALAAEPYQGRISAGMSLSLPTANGCWARLAPGAHSHKLTIETKDAALLAKIVALLVGK
jgi:hypothetical protein